MSSAARAWRTIWLGVTSSIAGSGSRAPSSAVRVVEIAALDQHAGRARRSRPRAGCPRRRRPTARRARPTPPRRARRGARGRARGRPRAARARTASRACGRARRRPRRAAGRRAGRPARMSAASAPSARSDSCATSRRMRWPPSRARSASSQTCGGRRDAREQRLHGQRRVQHAKRLRGRLLERGQRRGQVLGQAASARSAATAQSITIRASSSVRSSSSSQALASALQHLDRGASIRFSTRRGRTRARARHGRAPVARRKPKGLGEELHGVVVARRGWRRPRARAAARRGCSRAAARAPRG